MDRDLMLRKFREGFRRSVSGTSPLSLVGSKGFPMSRNVISGNLNRTITIDGVEYDVPYGITLLESINNNGSAWFDLGMPIGSSDIITFDIAWNSLPNKPFFGAYNAGGSYNRNSFVGTYSSSGSRKMFYNNEAGISYFLPTSGERGILKWNGLGVRATWNGVEFGSIPTIDFTPSKNAYLGTQNQGGTAGSADDITLYGFKVERNTNVVMLLIGAKNASNVVGVYDFIRGIYIAPQGGTCTAGAELPTPEQPLGWKGCGDKTENLFDKDANDTSNGFRQGQYIDINGNYQFFGNTNVSEYIEIEPSTSYYLVNRQAVGSACLCWYDVSKTYISCIASATGTKTSPTLAKYCRISYWNSDKDLVMLVKGNSIPQNYVPFGYKLTERVNGVNLFNPDNANTRYPHGWYASNGVVYNANTLNRTAIFPCSEGDVFTFKHYTAASGARYFWIYSDTIAIGEPCSSVYGEIIGTGPMTTTAAPSNAKYIGICFWRINGGTVQSAADDFVIVKGSTAPTTYEPYFAPTIVTTYIDKPLGKVGSYADTFDMASGEHAENVGEIVFDGTESWVDASSGDKHIYYTSIADRKTDGDFKRGFCTHFAFSTAIPSRVEDLRVFYYSSAATGFRCDAITSLAEWKAYLAAQYAAGTPVTVGYPKDTPTTTQHSPVQVTLPKGTVIIESTNEVKASNISTTYKSQTQLNT